MKQINNKYKKKEAFDLASKALLVMYNVLTDYKKERPQIVTGTAINSTQNNDYLNINVYINLSNLTKEVNN